MANARSVLVAAAIAWAVVASLAFQDSSPPPSSLWAAQTSTREITLVWSRVPGAVRYRIYEGESPQPLGQTMASGEQYVRPISTYGVEHRFSIDAIFETGEVSARVAFNPVIPAISTSGVSTLALLSNDRAMSWGAARAPLRGRADDFLTTKSPLPVPGVRNAVALSPYLILLRDGTVRELVNPETRVAGFGPNTARACAVGARETGVPEVRARQ